MPAQTERRRLSKILKYKQLGSRAVGEQRDLISNQPIFLTKIEPLDNAYRFLEFSVGEDLLGVCVQRRWGRVGFWEQSETFSFDSVLDAEAFTLGYALSKIKSGYVAARGPLSKVLLIAGKTQKTRADVLDSAQRLSRIGGARYTPLYGHDRVDRAVAPSQAVNAWIKVAGARLIFTMPYSAVPRS